MLQDLRFALRQLRKSPGFSLVVILTLAVGIGAATTVMTWANAVMFNPFPRVRDAQHLRFVSAQVNAGGGYSQHYGYQPAKDESMSIVTDSVAPDYFRTMRIPVLQGREFAEQDSSGAPWFRRRFFRSARAEEPALRGLQFRSRQRTGSSPLDGSDCAWSGLAAGAARSLHRADDRFANRIAFVFRQRRGA